MTREEMDRVLRKMTAMFASRVLSDDALETWHEELDGLDFSAAYAAARQVAREAAKMPTPAEFRGLTATHARRQKSYDLHQTENHCPSCDGTGWQETHPGTPPTVRACRVCSRVQTPEPRTTTWTA